MSEPNYEHRQMRCKLDRSARVGARRYRPGEILEEEHRGKVKLEDFEPVPQVVTASPPAKVEPIILRPVRPPKSQKEEGD